MPFVDKFFQPFLVGQVYLVDEQQHGDVHLFDLGEELLVLLCFLDDVRHIEQDIGVLQRRDGKRQHGLLQLVVRFQNAWRVRENNLGVVRVDDAHNAVARGLGFERGDRYALADE